DGRSAHAGSQQVAAVGRDRPAGFDGHDPLRWVWRVAVGTGLLVAGLFFGVFFDALTESELVEMSPLWIAPMAFGLIGRATRRAGAGIAGRLGLAAAGMVLAFLGAAVFLRLVWPLL